MGSCQKLSVESVRIGAGVGPDDIQFGAAVQMHMQFVQTLSLDKIVKREVMRTQDSRVANLAFEIYARIKRGIAGRPVFVHEKGDKNGER
ncbi:hypothetical protein ASG39_22480 [Rhizobium sp. Leaf371]|nr:hypothetical protein ASG39_22480 [Rhizobium sp. Leaf371]